MSISANYDYQNYYSLNNSSLSSLTRYQTASDSKEEEEESLEKLELLQPKSPLSSLVEDGTITSEQEKAVKEALEAARLAFQTPYGASAATGSDPLSSLVASGTLSEDEAAAVKEALEASKPPMNGPPPPPPPGTEDEEETDTLAAILDSLAADESLTDEQKSTLTSYFESAMKAYIPQSYLYDASYDSTSFKADV